MQHDQESPSPALLNEPATAGRQVIAIKMSPLWGVLLLALVLRIPGLERPLVGNFATKQAVYGMIARNFARARAPAWLPTLNELRGGAPSYHLLEWPLPAYLTGAVWRVCGGSLDLWGRLSSVIWSLLGCWLLYRLLERWCDRAAAAGGALTLALSPVAITYGQSFQMEAALLPLMLGTVLALERFLDAGRLRWLVVASLCWAALLLTKIYLLAMILPLGAIVWIRRPVSRRSIVWLAGLGLLSLLPAVAWYGFAFCAADGAAGVDPERIYFSVRRSSGDHPFPHPILFSAGFYQQVLDDISGVVLTPVGLGLAALGLVLPNATKMPRSRWLPLLAWLAAAGAMVILLPRKFHEMNYYWVALVPLGATLAGLGCSALWRLQSSSLRWLPLLALWLVLSLRYCAGPAFATPAEDRAVVAAATALRRVSAKTDRVVAVHGTSLDLLYYCDRDGWAWPGVEQPAAEVLHGFRRQQARWLVVAGLDQLSHDPALAQALAIYPVAASGDDFVVVRLSGE